MVCQLLLQQLFTKVPSVKCWKSKRNFLNHVSNANSLKPLNAYWSNMDKQNKSMVFDSYDSLYRNIKHWRGQRLLSWLYIMIIHSISLAVQFGSKTTLGSWTSSRSLLWSRLNSNNVKAFHSNRRASIVHSLR